VKILIVDDSAADRRICRIHLEESGYPDLEFLEANNAAQGLEICRTVQLDCILIDYRLPDMSGVEFLKDLFTGDSRTNGFGIVMLTGLGRQVASAALEAGAHDYLLKDHLSAESLSLAIQKATTRSRLVRMLKTDRDHLANLLAEKEVLLREIHHRVKNNLAVIASLLSLQANSQADPRLADALRASQNRVESMALIHEQLYATEGVREVDLAQHASLLARSLFHSYGIDPAQVSWQVKMEPLQLGLDQAIPAALILGELVSNALKHAFPDARAGIIMIESARRDGRIELTVSDDGIGMDESMEFSRPKSLGMQIVKILTRQLKGTFHVESRRPARFRISIPETHNEEHQGYPPDILQSAGSGG
jgi:two-component sensor histidine kinase